MRRSWFYYCVVGISIIMLINSCQLGLDNEQNNDRSLINIEKKNPVTILRWMGNWHGEGNKELMINELANNYSFLNQEIDLQLEFPDQIFNVPSEKLYEIHSDSIAKMAKYDKWPFDILFCDQARYSRVSELLNNPSWGKDYLVDFSQEPWFAAAHKDHIFDNDAYKSTYGGIIPGPLLEGSANILYTSYDVQKKLGIEVKKTDMTIDDFVSYAKAVNDYNQSHADKIYFFSNQYWNATAILFTQLAMSAYGKKEPASRDEAILVLKKTYASLETLSAYKPLEQYEKASKESRVLYQDKYLFVVSPSWMYILWQMNNAKGVEAMFPAELPAFENQPAAVYSGGYNVVFVVPKHGKNVEAAKNFIKYLSSSETALKWSKYSKCPTGLKADMLYTDFGQDDYSKYYQHIQQKYGNNQQEVELSSLFFNKTSKIDFKFNEVLNGSISAEDALKAVKMQI